MVGEIADHLVIVRDSRRHFMAGAEEGGLHGEVVASFGRILQGALTHLRAMIREGDVCPLLAGSRV